MTGLILVAGAGEASGQAKTAEYCPAGFVSVLAFGAKGDGATDDTQAFRWAAQSGNGIFVPAGDFRISDSVVLDSRVMIGAGEDKSVITFTGEDARKPIVMAGSYASLRDLTLRFAEGLVTGEEQEGDRTAILTGAKWGLQRGASLRRVTLENVGTGVFAAEGTDALVAENGISEAGAFSVTFEDVTVRDFSWRGFYFSGKTRTGNVFRNLYFTSRFDADSALYFTGEESESVVEGILLENVRAACPIYMYGMRANKFGSIALYNTEITVANNALITLEDTNGAIDALTVRNCRAGQMLLRVGRGDYEYGDGKGSPTSWLKIGTLTLDTVAGENPVPENFAFIGRRSGDKGAYAVEIDRYLYAPGQGDGARYRSFLCTGDALTVTVKEAAEL